MPKCDFNKFAKQQLYWNHILAWVFSCEFATYFQKTFSSEHLWTAATENGLRYLPANTELVIEFLTES